MMKKIMFTLVMLFLAVASEADNLNKSPTVGGATAGNKEAVAKSGDVKHGKFIPAGYRLFKEVYGDLNGDGMDDYVAVIKATDKKNIEYDQDRGEPVDLNPRGIMISFSDNGAYKRVLENRRCFDSENGDGGGYFAPELNVTIKKGNLYIGYDHGRYGGWQYTFRYRNSGFELIGVDNCVGIAGRIDKEISINLLTKKMKTRIYDEDDIVLIDDVDKNKKVFTEEWKDIKIEKVYKLSEIKHIDELDKLFLDMR